MSYPTYIHFINIINIRILSNTFGEYIEIVSLDNITNVEKINTYKIMTFKLRILFKYMVELWKYSMNHVQQLSTYQKRYKDGQFNEKLKNYYEKRTKDDKRFIQTCLDLNRNRLKHTLCEDLGISSTEVIHDRMFKFEVYPFFIYY